MTSMKQQLAVGDISLTYEVSGDQRAGTPSMVLLHGFVGSTADWAGVLPALATGRRVLAYDQRGHGDSSKPGTADAYTFDALTADLHGFLTGLDLGPVDLLGHSMGGVVAQRYALAHPEAVRSLILMDTAPEPSRSPFKVVLWVVGVIARRRGMGAVGKIVNALLKPKDGAGQGDDQDPKARQERQEIQERQAAAFLGMDPVAFAAFAKALNSYPSLVGRLGGITCPTTVLVGARDKALQAGVRQLADGIPGARLTVVDDAGHSPQTERPDAWLAAVAAHFDRLEDLA